VYERMIEMMSRPRFRLMTLVLMVLVLFALPLLAYAEEATGGIAEEVVSDPDVLYAIGLLLATVVVVLVRRFAWLAAVARAVKPAVNWADQLGLLAGIKGKDKLMAALDAFAVEYEARTGHAPGPNEKAEALRRIEQEVKATSGQAKDKLKNMLVEVATSTDPASAVGNSSGGSD
jgi:hypothetical protein